MVPITPEGPVPPQQAVHCFRHASRESLATACQAHLALGLDEQMDVIRLHAPVQHPEGAP
jgi:hypothetical protein